MSFSRKPLFSKPAWAVKFSSFTSTSTPEAPRNEPSSFTLTSDEDEDDKEAAPIFGHKHVYEDIVAQERQRREKHAMKVRAREANNKSSGRGAQKQREGVDVGNAKRRRISKDVEDDEESDDATDKSDGSEDSDIETKRSPSSPVAANVKGAGNRRTETKGSLTEKKPSTPGKNRPRTRAGATNAIDLDSDDDYESNDKTRAMSGSPDVLITGQRPSTRANKQQNPDPESESDEEDEFLRELKRSAREEARMKRLGITTSQVASPTTKTQTASMSNDAHAPGTQPAASPAFGDIVSPVGGGHPVSIDPRSPSKSDIASPSQDGKPGQERDTATPNPDDPEVQILINTMIPNAKKLIVNRRASQPLDKVKEFWCQRNELHPKIASKVFFTWNGMRLFDSTTMRGVIEMLKRTHPTKDGSDPSGGRIMIEAVTDEIFEYRKQQTERRRKEAEMEAKNASPEGSTTANGTKKKDEDGENPTNNDNSTDTNAPAERSGPIIRLLCPDVEEMNIRLRPHTSVAKIITAFRTMRHIDSAKQCWLSYDGDRLEMEQTAEEIGFENDDCVDVYLR